MKCRFPLAGGEGRAAARPIDGPAESGSECMDHLPESFQEVPLAGPQIVPQADVGRDDLAGERLLRRIEQALDAVQVAVRRLMRQALGTDRREALAELV